MLTEGVYFDSHTVYSLPVNKSFVTRAFQSLISDGVVRKSRAKGKYLFTDSFLESVRREIMAGMPRGIFVHYPDLIVFDVCGIESWTEEELSSYVRRLKERWVVRTDAL